MAEITTTQAFSDGDTVTATKLNNITANAAIQTEVITNRSAETTVDQANDLLLMYDASATALKKVSLSNVIKAGTASNFPVSGSIELGHASDTTLSRGSAGRLRVEGVDVVTATSTDTLTNKTLTSPAINGGTINNASVGATTPSTGAFTTLSASGDVAVADKIIHSGDTNTAIRFPAADTVTVETSGTERVRIDSSGNVILTGNKSLISRGAGGVSTNSAIGDGALQANTTGYYNTANGYAALYSNTTGYNNTANGLQALYSNTTGVYNTANGYAALYSNTTGNNNTANGYQALFSNTTGYANTANGVNALYSNTTGYANTANGQSALVSNTTGFSNTANGVNALYSNTTGVYNTANGYAALYSNTTGYNNTANGQSALFSNTTGFSNTANGVSALYSNTTGDSNTSLGFQAGYGANGTNANTTGSNNTFIGNEAVGTSSTASNVITLGNGSIATLRCQVTTITGLSDRRDKKDIAPLSSGLGLVNLLKPVSFVWNARDGKKVDVPEIGFIAQDLQEAQAQSGLNVPNLVHDDNPDKLEASPATLIPVLVRAVQELSEEVRQLKAKLKE